MSELVFVKLGGSVITDKTQPETVRPETLSRLAKEVASALSVGSIPSPSSGQGLRVVLGHGSGSFGHMVANRHGTRKGVRSVADWQGFAGVAAVAARLNRIVTDAFLAAGVPVWSIQPSASARCQGGELVSLETFTVEQALGRGLVPLLYGDVALDDVLGGTIISTEQVFAYLARQLRPARLILAGVADGVFEGDPLRDPSSRHIPEISSANWHGVRALLGASHGIDVTGGMRAKVDEMVNLARDVPGLEVIILSGERVGALKTALLTPSKVLGGTRIHW
ncbi:MAG TPA: isopentenyl phosphate kinase [Anaerolineae bacterium]|nr:isopentenyl phosphate kinase [Anaerolineae bacterium]